MTELSRAAVAQPVPIFSASPSKPVDARAQDAISVRERQARFEAIAATLPGVICELRAKPDGTASFPYASPQIHDLYGLTAEELAVDARAAFARVHPDDVASVLTALEESSRTLAPCCFEYRVLNPQRGEVWVEMRARPARDPDGSTHWCAFLSDVTARQTAHDALRGAQDRLRAALDASGMGTWAWDPIQDRIELDDASLTLLGLAPSRSGGVLRTRQLFSFVHPEDAWRLRRMVERARGGDPGTPTEIRVLSPGGGTRHIALKGSGVTDATGRLLRMTGVCTDVTAQKRLQEAQLRAQKLEALGTLAGGIAHEFNNLLFAMLGNTKLISDELGFDHPVQDGLAEIAHAAQRAAELVRGVQAFSRPASETPRKPLQLRSLVEDVLRLLRVKLPSNVELSVRAAPGLPRIAADASQIQPMIVNLVDNAIHAIGSARGAIDVSLEVVQVQESGPHAVSDLSDGRYVMLAASDTGCGMAPATLERIFDPFFTTKLPGQGPGLGLSVAHGIMRSHGGAITVASERGRGSVFRLYFPAMSLEEPMPAADSGMVVGTRSQRILVVDDEPALVKLVSRMLSREGYRVTGMSNAHEALELFRSAPDAFDAVVTDLTMPIMSGFELVEALRMVRPDVPVLMTSGDLGEDALARAELVGIEELIPKPNTVAMLVAALDRAFGREQRADERR